MVQPGGRARFNVPIRTVVLRGSQAKCGVGSGITADATAEGEWAEWTHKTQFLEQASRPFRLLQTIRGMQGRWQHLELHLDRLAAAAAHFGFPFQRDLVRRHLETAYWDSNQVKPRGRVMIDVRGEQFIEQSALPVQANEVLPVRLALAAIQAPPAFLRHKTTHRAHYEQFGAGSQTCFDTLMWNARAKSRNLREGAWWWNGPTANESRHRRSVAGSMGWAGPVSSPAGRASEAVIRLGELNFGASDLVRECAAWRPSRCPERR